MDAFGLAWDGYVRSGCQTDRVEAETVRSDPEPMPDGSSPSGAALGHKGPGAAQQLQRGAFDDLAKAWQTLVAGGV